MYNLESAVLTSVRTCLGYQLPTFPLLWFISLAEALCSLYLQEVCWTPKVDSILAAVVQKLDWFLPFLPRPEEEKVICTESREWSTEKLSGSMNDRISRVGRDPLGSLSPIPGSPGDNGIERTRWGQVVLSIQRSADFLREEHRDHEDGTWILRRM